eukprot:scaffold5861_cov126-Isochrysis_galbana.AAC.4
MKAGRGCGGTHAKIDETVGIAARATAHRRYKGSYKLNSLYKPRLFHRRQNCAQGGGFELQRPRAGLERGPMHSATQQQQGFFLRDAFAQLDAVLQRKREASDMHAAADAELRRSQQVRAERARAGGSPRHVRLRQLLISPGPRRLRHRSAGHPALAGDFRAAAPAQHLHEADGGGQECGRGRRGGGGGEAGPSPEAAAAVALQGGRR